MDNRRSFLRQLVGLPLIGGGVTLIGQPTAVAEPVTLDLLEAYKCWLSEELSYLAWEMASRLDCEQRYHAEDAVERSRLIRSVKFNVGEAGHWHDSTTPNASTRAALVLSTVNCDWKGGLHG